MPWRGRGRKAILIGFTFALHCDRKDAARDMYKKMVAVCQCNFITPCFGKWACRFSACGLILGLTPPWIKPYFFSWSFVDVRETNTFPPHAKTKRRRQMDNLPFKGLKQKSFYLFQIISPVCSYSTREKVINDDTKGASHQWWSRCFSSVVFFFSPQEF